MSRTRWIAFRILGYVGRCVRVRNEGGGGARVRSTRGGREFAIDET